MWSRLAAPVARAGHDGLARAAIVAPGMRHVSTQSVTTIRSYDQCCMSSAAASLWKDVGSQTVGQCARGARFSMAARPMAGGSAVRRIVVRDHTKHQGLFGVPGSVHDDVTVPKVEDLKVCCSAER